MLAKSEGVGSILSSGPRRWDECCWALEVISDSQFPVHPRLAFMILNSNSQFQGSIHTSKCYLMLLHKITRVLNIHDGTKIFDPN
jgi:hypothetical protein